jgi:hypothetical protein
MVVTAAVVPGDHAVSSRASTTMASDALSWRIVRAGPDRDLAATALPFACSIDGHLAHHDLQTSHTRTGLRLEGCHAG